MSHSLHRLRSKVFNTPQLMQVTKFDDVVDYLNRRCSGEASSGSDQDKEEQPSQISYNSDMQVAVMDIQGPLTYKPVTFMGMDCGGANYQTLKEEFTSLVSQGVKTVAFMADSPGGEAFQLFPTAQYIRELATQNGVKLITYVDGLAASAMYGLAAISDEIVMAPGAEVGSIGVVVRLMNDSKALEKEGYQRTFVTAGKSKVPFNEDGEFREEFIQDIQDKVNVLYQEFTEHVATHRNMSVEAVRSTEAKTFLPSVAIELGLADSVMPIEAFYDYLATVAQSNKGSNMLKSSLFSTTKLHKEETLDMTQLADMQAQLEAVQAELTGAQASLVEFAKVKEQLATLTASYEAQAAELIGTKEQLEAAQEAVKQMQVEKEAQKMAARKEKLSAVMAADQVESVQASLASLSDEAFETVVAGFAKQKQVVEASDLMQELGGEGGEPEAVTKPKTSTTEDAIKQRLGLK